MTKHNINIVFEKNISPNTTNPTTKVQEFSQKAKSMGFKEVCSLSVNRKINIKRIDCNPVDIEFYIARTVTKEDLDVIENRKFILSPACENSDTYSASTGEIKSIKNLNIVLARIVGKVNLENPITIKLEITTDASENIIENCEISKANPKFIPLSQYRAYFLKIFEIENGEINIIYDDLDAYSSDSNHEGLKNRHTIAHGIYNQDWTTEIIVTQPNTRIEIKTDGDKVKFKYNLISIF